MSKLGIYGSATAAGALLLGACAYGQMTVAPTGEPTESNRGQNVAGYNILNSFETGYRLRSVDGNLNKYRSDINYGNGVALLSSSLSIHSRDGKGRFFDEVVLTTQGLGSDPYQYAALRIEKNRVYRYELTWRESDYFNPALPISYGLHRMDTSRRLQDHSLRFFDQSRFRLQAGYSRNAQDGPGLTTINVLGPVGAEFPLFSDIRRTQDEYRVGGEIVDRGFRLSVVRAWEFFREDTTDRQSGSPGIESPGTLDAFRRDQPAHGTVGHWRGYLLFDRWKFLGLNGRFAYADGRQNFIYDESAATSLGPGAALVRQTFISGSANRPVTAANLTANIFLSEKLTLTNHTSFHQTRVEGNSQYEELGTAGDAFSTVNFQFLGVRLFSNTTTLDYRPLKTLGIYGGYDIAERRIQSVEEPGGALSEQHNRLNAVTAGIRLIPFAPLTIKLDAEVGRADHPVYPTSEKDYHGLGARVQYRKRTLQLSVAARSAYNFNSAALSTHSAHTRTYSADASWTPTARFGFDASYSKLHVDTLTGIAYFASRALVDDHSWYVSNIHSATGGAHLAATNRISLFVGFTHVQDTGGDQKAGVQTDALFAAQVFPLSYTAPLARVSFSLKKNVRWNAGYQFYRYAEESSNFQNYRAHTGYTSISWSF